jgi:hypothetical protein
MRFEIEADIAGSGKAWPWPDVTISNESVR